VKPTGWTLRERRQRNGVVRRVAEGGPPRVATGEDDARTQRSRVCVALALVATIGHSLGQRIAQSHRHLVDVVDQQRSARSASQRTLVLLRERRIGTGRTTEQLATEQRFGERACRQHDQGSGVAFAPRVHRARNMVLARARRTRDENGEFESRRRHRPVDDLLRHT
jgi:hypothetical protein